MASATWHTQQAEKFADTAARHMTEDPRDMRISEVAAGIAQAYAALALSASRRSEAAAEPTRADAAETAASDDGLWALIEQVSWRWSADERRAEFAAYFGFEPSEADTRHLAEFLRVVRFLFPRYIPKRVQCAVPKAAETFVDFSDLAANGPSTTADEAWANVEAYVRQRARALSAYAVNPEARVDIADEVTPGHVLRWSSLQVLLESRATAKAVAA